MRMKPGDVLRLDAFAHLVAESEYVRRGVQVPDAPIRVFVVDSHPVVRAGIRTLLVSAPELEIVGESADTAGALEQIGCLLPDVTMLDCDPPAGDGVEEIRTITTLFPDCRVLILSTDDEGARLLELLEAGARGYLRKDAHARELIDAIRVVASGQLYLDHSLARQLAVRVQNPGSSNQAIPQLELLSPRELVVLRLIAEGFSASEIGRQLGISSKTVESYKQRITEKIGIMHRADYVRFALRTGVIHS
jgi:two-component system, NarL family, response regulator NreC